MCQFILYRWVNAVCVVSLARRSAATARSLTPLSPNSALPLAFLPCAPPPPQEAGHLHRGAPGRRGADYFAPWWHIYKCRRGDFSLVFQGCFLFCFVFSRGEIKQWLTVAVKCEEERNGHYGSEMVSCMCCFKGGVYRVIKSFCFLI